MTRSMHLSCDRARMRLQAPLELDRKEYEELQSHIETCNACAKYRESMADMDTAIMHTVAGQSAGISVRSDVQRRIRQGTRPRKRFRVPSLALVPVILAAAAVLLSLIPPLKSVRTGPTHALASGWTPVRIGISFPLTVDSSDSNHLLVGALGRVYESWDAGSHWRPLAPIGSSNVIMDLAIDRANPRHYLVATLRSVLSSFDAGRHWTTAVSGLLGVENMFLLQDPYVPSTFYVGPSALWKSTDDGRNWHLAGDTSMFSPDGIQTLAIGPHDRLYTGVWNNGVGISSNGGLTWQRRSHGLEPKVMTVSVAHGRLLAATDTGIFRSTNDGLAWHRSGPAMTFFTTSVFDGGSYQLAGGNGGVFRSIDGGRHWSVAVDGLPLYSYIHGFVGDPRHPLRVYVSLDGDGNFRSDDGGLHWRPINTGLPIAGLPVAPGNTSAPLVLFTRQGTLWKTDAVGTDPGTLTVDNTVSEAGVSPDFAAVAYVTTSPGTWSLKVVGAGGSAATDLLSAAGRVPRKVVWSPDSIRIAAIGGTKVHVSDLNGHVAAWTRVSGERFLAWSTDGSGMLFWSMATHRILERSWRAGVIMNPNVATAPEQPFVSPNEDRIAFIAHGALDVATWSGPPTRIAVVPTGCRLISWSDSGSALLLRCGATARIVALSGRIFTLHRAAGTVTWAPESSDTLLVFRNGSLWRWTPGRKPTIIVSSALPALPEAPTPRNR